MLFKLILVLTITPIIELYLLIQLTQLTSFATTLLVILATGVVGAALARMEGLRVLGRIQSEMQQGRLPGDSLLDGGMILVAGALLVTPGILTDTVGFLILIPFTRAALRRLLKRWLRRKMEEGQVRFYKQMGFGPIRDEPPPGAPPLEDRPEDRGDDGTD